MNNNDLMKNKFYDYYSKKTTVTIPEAVALSLDYDPRVIIWHNNNYRLLRKDDGRGFSKSFIEEYCTRVDILESDILNATQVQNTRLQYIHSNQVHLHIIPKWCKFRDFSFPEKLKVLIRKYYVSDGEDLEAKCKRLEVENEELKKSQEGSKLDIRTEKRFVEMLAIMAKINKDFTGDSFNANNISNKAANYEFNFRIMSEETMRKYIAPARKLLGLPRVYKNNKTIPKN